MANPSGKPQSLNGRRQAYHWRRIQALSPAVGKKTKNFTTDDTDNTDLHGLKIQLGPKGNRVIARDLVIGLSESKSLPLIGAYERGSERHNLTQRH